LRRLVTTLVWATSCVVFVGFLQADLLAPGPTTLSQPRRGTGRPEDSRQMRGGAGEANVPITNVSGGGGRLPSWLSIVHGLETMRNMDEGMAAELGRAAIVEARLRRTAELGLRRAACRAACRVPLVLATVVLVTGAVPALYLVSVSDITPLRFHHHDK
jgi:hypothetical protein